MPTLLIVAIPFLIGQAPPAEPAAPPGGAVRSLVVIQEANGLPNQQTKELVPQRVIIAPDRLLLEDGQTGVAYLLRLDRDPPSIIEISEDAKHYREGRALDQIQRERDKTERELLERLAKAPEAERRTTMAEMHLRPGLAREVSVRRFDEEREILGRKARRIEVRENGRVIVDAWLAEEELGIPFFEFYRRVGAFSEAVLEKLREVDGLPLEVDFLVVTATLNYRIEVRARKIDVDDVPARFFEIPAGAEKVEESPFANCPICGQQVEKAAPAGGSSRLRDGTRVYFDRRECTAEFNHREYPERFPRKKP